MRAADSARVVHLCACSQARVIAHKWPTHALRLTQALGKKPRSRNFVLLDVSVCIMTDMSKFKAIWNLGWPIWVSLFIGLLVVSVSFLVGFKFPASGAVLVCSAIVSELAYTRLRWHRGKTTTVGLKDGMPVQGIFESLINSEELWALSRNSEMYSNGWRISDTANRISFYMAVIIAGAAIIGTIIWGYGDMVDLNSVEACCCE